MLSEESTVSNEWGRAHGRMSMSPGHMRWTGRMEVSRASMLGGYREVTVTRRMALAIVRDV